MNKLKKLFPLSFKFNKSIGSLLLCALFYILIEMVAGFVIGLAVEPIVSLIIKAIFSPITIIGLALYYLGVLIGVCTLGIGNFIASPLINVGYLIMYIPEIVTMLVIAIITSMATIYTMVGCVVAVLSYAGVIKDEDAATAPEKPELAEAAEPAAQQIEVGEMVVKTEETPAEASAE